MLRRIGAWLLVAIAAASCTDINQYPTAPAPAVYTSGSSTAPSSPSNPRADVIEFRVSGTATSARIRFSTSVDGLTQVITNLPFIVTVTSTAPAVFVSLEATPSFTLATNPFLNAQIFVNGDLFREATASDFFTTLTVSGTWRH